jgi:hypothetical protein
VDLIFKNENGCVPRPGPVSALLVGPVFGFQDIFAAGTSFRH